MPALTRPYNPAFPSPPPQIPPASPNSTKRLVPLLQSPPVGAGILAITFFFFIAFFSNVLLAQIALTTLGIAVTLSTFGILALVVLILFLL